MASLLVMRAELSVSVERYIDNRLYILLTARIYIDFNSTGHFSILFPYPFAKQLAIRAGMSVFITRLIQVKIIQYFWKMARRGTSRRDPNTLHFSNKSQSKVIDSVALYPWTCKTSLVLVTKAAAATSLCCTIYMLYYVTK